ncbi:hypothetical protein [Dactylosporangium sp. CA-139066]|uniref:hypothetical protein n=1 Tax=Dactylosporangium sp. CA-139066 TaxID=3239930 RepID=UPI003D92A5E8
MGVQVMGWMVTERTAIVAVAVVAAVVTAAGTIVLARRRRRLHKQLIEEAARVLCEPRAEAPGPAWSASLDLVRILAAYDEQADRLDRDVRPRIPAHPGKRAPLTGLLIGVEVAVDIHGALAVLCAPERQLDGMADTPEPTREEYAGLPGPMVAVPRLPDGEDALECCLGLGRVLADAVRRGRIVVAHARALQVIGDECRERLSGVFGSVDGAVRESAKLADAGNLVQAMRVLSEVGLPVPEEGVPGHALQRDLDRQNAWLRRVAVEYRAAVLGWCLEALERCGVAAPAMPGVTG